MTDNSLWYTLEGEKPYGIYELSTTAADADRKLGLRHGMDHFRCHRFLDPHVLLRKLSRH